MNRIIRGAGVPIVVYDVAMKTVVHELVDFALRLSDVDGLSNKTIDTTINHLVRFSNHLLVHAAGRKYPLLQALSGVSDSKLKCFRDVDLAAVISNPRARQSERKAKTTVNERLSAVYRWLWWLKCAGRLVEGVAGPNACAVTVGIRELPGGRRSRRMSLNMPLLFPDGERRSKHRTGFVATREVADRVVETVMSRPSGDYRNLRDALIVDLAVEVGLRVGSIASLLVSDFDRVQIEGTAELTVPITPAHQKFSYQNSFDVPVWLALRVCALIDLRDEHIASKGKKASVCQNSIFLNELRCTPMTPRAISQSIGGLLRAMGAPKGSSIHSFRGLFCTEEIEREIDYRVRAGLDTSTATVSAAVGLKMGHRDPMSIFPYVARAISLRAARERAARVRLPPPS